MRSALGAKPCTLCALTGYECGPSNIHIELVKWRVMFERFVITNWRLCPKTGNERLVSWLSHAGFPLRFPVVVFLVGDMFVWFMLKQAPKIWLLCLSLSKQPQVE